MTNPSEALSPDRAPSRAGVERAALKIAQILPPTPLMPLEVNGVTVWCKAECLQPVGAFKIRGGWHRLSDLDEAQAARGVVAFSSGNHAQGVAWAARRLGIPATIVMPGDSPRAKMEGTRALGAAVVTYDRMTGSREEIAARIAAETGAVVVPSFDDPWIIEGQGSCGYEVARQFQEYEMGRPTRFIACCGGGGLAAGCALALRSAEFTVVEPEGWDDMGRSLEAGEILPVGPNPPPTSCDALQTLRVSPLTFDVLHERGVRGVAVSEAEVAHAMRVAYEKLHLVLEPGGAVALAAVLAGKAEIDTRTVVTLSGGNVDWATYRRMIEAA